MNLAISKCVTAVKVSNFSCNYLRNRSTLDIGVLGYIGILKHKEHPHEVWSVPPVTPCIWHLSSDSTKILYRTVQKVYWSDTNYVPICTVEAMPFFRDFNLCSHSALLFSDLGERLCQGCAQYLCLFWNWAQGGLCPSCGRRWNAFSVYRETVWSFESKERLATACVLRQGGHLLPCC